MKKISYVLFCLCFLVLSATAVSAQRQTKSQMNNDDWVGEYKYTYTEGKTEGGDVPVIEYLLVVSKKGDALVAHFTVDGYQAYDDYSYTAKANGNQLNLYFLKDLRSADMPGMNRHLKRGQLMGSLSKNTVRGKSRYSFKDNIFFNPQRPPVFKKS